MTRALGVMGLPVPVAADDLRAYQTGALRGGGLWEALRRVGDHDHSGGQAGAPVAGAGTDPALEARVAALEAQVATLLSQLAGHTHTSGTIDAMGGAAVLP